MESLTIKSSTKTVLKVALMLVLILSVSIMMAACGAIEQNGKWQTYKKAGGTGGTDVYQLTDTSKSYGQFYNTGAGNTVSAVSASYPNANNLIITRTENASDPENIVYNYSLSSIYVFIDKDVKTSSGIKSVAAADGKPAHTILLTWKNKNGDTQYTAVTSSTTTKLFNTREATQVSATMLSVSPGTLSNLDITQNLTVSCIYYTYATGTVEQTFSYVFELGKAVFK